MGTASQHVIILFRLEVLETAHMLPSQLSWDGVEFDQKPLLILPAFAIIVVADPGLDGSDVAHTNIVSWQRAHTHFQRRFCKSLSLAASALSDDTQIC